MCIVAKQRCLWEGTEGIAWLCLTGADKIESGAFYLDRKPQTKHLSGIFFSEVQQQQCYLLLRRYMLIFLIFYDLSRARTRGTLNRKLKK